MPGDDQQRTGEYLCSSLKKGGSSHQIQERNATEEVSPFEEGIGYHQITSNARS
jgi:hypothetical protein